MARQASSPSLYALARAMACTDEAEQQLSRLAPSVCELSGDFSTFGTELREALDMDTRATFEV